MGAEQSGHCSPFPSNDHHKIDDFKWVYRIKNDYELAIRLSKELEYYLSVHFQATGKGLHEKITSAERGYEWELELSTFLKSPRMLQKNI